MTWNKNWPVGSLPASFVDDAIHLNNDHLEEGLSREHEFPGTYGTDSLRHKFPMPADKTAMDLITGPVDGMLLVRPDVQVLFSRQASVFVPIFGYTYGTNADRVAFAPTADLPTGIVWFESDTGRAYVWNGSAWVDLLSWYAPESPTREKDTSTYAHFLSAADTWEKVLKAAATNLSVSWTCPATGVWDLEVRARIGVEHTGNTSETSIRLCQDYDSVLTYPDDCWVENRFGFASNNELEAEVEGIDSATEDGKVIEFTVECACDQTPGEVQVNGGSGGAGGSTPSKSWIKLKAYRVG